LPDCDTFSKSDPLVVVYLKTEGIDSKKKVVGVTEEKKNDLNPTFTTHIKIPYYFEKNQKITFKVYDSDFPVDNYLNKDEA